MDHTHLVATLYNNFVQEHPFIEANPKLRRAAAIGDALEELYQSGGQAAFAIHHSDGTPLPRQEKKWRGETTP